MSSRLPKRSSHYSSSHAKKQSNQIVRRPLSREAVAQSKGVIEFLCVCYKVTVRDRIISVTEEPLWLSGSLSGGRRKRSCRIRTTALVCATASRNRGSVGGALRHPRECCFLPNRGVSRARFHCSCRTRLDACIATTAPAERAQSMTLLAMSRRICMPIDPRWRCLRRAGWVEVSAHPGVDSVQPQTVVSGDRGGWSFMDGVDDLSVVDAA